MMPLESRVTSVLSPDERMWRRGLIKQMTKRAGLGQKKQSFTFFLFMLYRPFREKNKAIRWGGQGVCVGVIWSQFEMHGKAAG